MPITIKDLLSEINIKTKPKNVKWGEPIEYHGSGVYIVSISNDISKNTTIAKPPISEEILSKWMTLTNGFKLDNVMTTDQEKVKERLSNFWLSDENIIYIGKATDLGVRVNQYYKTAIAKSGPHSGGHWIKLLNNIESLTVHYFPCQQPEEIEYILLDEFGKHVSAKSYKHLIDKDVILPFANLEKKKIKRFIKKHGLEGMRL